MFRNLACPRSVPIRFRVVAVVVSQNPSDALSLSQSLTLSITPCLFLQLDLRDGRVYCDNIAKTFLTEGQCLSPL